MRSAFTPYPLRHFPVVVCVPLCIYSHALSPHRDIVLSLPVTFVLSPGFLSLSRSFVCIYKLALLENSHPYVTVALVLMTRVAEGGVRRDIESMYSGKERMEL